MSYTREVERSWDIQYETGEVRDMSERVRKELEGKYYKKQGDRENICRVVTRSERDTSEPKKRGSRQKR